MRRGILVALCWALTLAAVRPAWACEPIVPLMQVLGGPAFLVPSLWALLGFVALKCVAFAVLQRGLPWTRALLYLLVGNVLTTVIGAATAFVMAAPSVGFFVLPVLWAASFLPARRLVKSVPYLRERGVAPLTIAFALAGLFAASILLFALAQAMSEVSLALYWMIKYAYVMAALVLGIVMTTFWEEWIVATLAARRGVTSSFVVPVLRANLLVLLLASLTAAWLILPERLRSPDFLVQWIASCVGEA